MAKKSDDVKKPDASANLVDPGKAAPAFSMPDQTGKTHAKKDYVGRWLVIYFYPKDNTPGCTKEACSFRDMQTEFEKRNAAVLGVSPDTEKKHAKFIEKYDLNFDLLADTEQTLCSQFGVWQEKSMYGRKYMGVVRTTYLIDPKGNVAFRWDKVKVKGHDDEVLAKIDELSA